MSEEVAESTEEVSLSAEKPSKGINAGIIYGLLYEREMQFRVGLCRDAGVPMTNYGIAIAKMNGILERATKIFTL